MVFDPQLTAYAADADKEYLFNYRFGGDEWGIRIHANSPAEAKEKIKAVALARYEGEVALTIRVPGGTTIHRIWRWLANGFGDGGR